MYTDDCTLEDVEGALAFVASDDRELWYRVGMALRCEFGEAGYTAFSRWSAGGKGYREATCQSVWRSFKNTRVPVGFIFKLAYQNGWRRTHHSPQALEGFRQQAIKRRAEAEARLQQEQQEAERWHGVIADFAAKLWAGLPTQGESPYLVRKQVQSHGVRFINRGLIVLFNNNFSLSCIHGSANIKAFFDNKPDVSFLYLRKGSIVIPLHNAQNRIVNLQIINAGGNKLFLKHGLKQGHFYLMGSPQPGQQIGICEGFATAATVRQLMGWPTVVAFDAGNLPPVAVAVKQRYPACEIIMCADNDPVGIAKASEAGRLVGGKIAIPRKL